MTFPLLLLSISALLAPAIGSAETIKIPIGQQAQEKRHIERPATGMTKDAVQAHYGEPIETRPARGTPPISSWVYPEFVVYFESDHVIHTVLNAK